MISVYMCLNVFKNLRELCRIEFGENERLFHLTHLFNLTHVNSNLIFILRILGENPRSFRLEAVCNTIFLKLCLNRLVPSSRYTGGSVPISDYFFETQLFQGFLLLNSFSESSEILNFDLTVTNIISKLCSCIDGSFQTAAFPKECTFLENTSLCSVTRYCCLQTCHSAAQFVCQYLCFSGADLTLPCKF